jgi:hypothetical protein
VCRVARKLRRRRFFGEFHAECVAGGDTGAGDVADGDTNTGTDGTRHGNADAGSNRNTDGDLDTAGQRHAGADANTDGESQRIGFPDRNADGNPAAHRNADSHAVADTDTDTDTDTDGNAATDGDADTVTNADSRAFGRAQRQSDHRERAGHRRCERARDQRQRNRLHGFVLRDRHMFGNCDGDDGLGQRPECELHHDRRRGRLVFGNVQRCVTSVANGCDHRDDDQLHGPRAQRREELTAASAAGW